MWPPLWMCLRMVFCCNCPLCIGVSVLSLHRCPAVYSEFGMFMLMYACCWCVLSLLCVVWCMCEHWYVPGWCAYMQCSAGPRSACTEMLESGEHVWSPWNISWTPVWMRAWLVLWPSRQKFLFTNRTGPAFLFLYVLLLNQFFIAVTKLVTSMQCYHPRLNVQCHNSWDKCTWMFTSTCVHVLI